MKALIRLALVASVLYGTGAHWAALQTYAWASMAVAGQTDPCRVCKVVEKGSTAKQTPSILRSGPSVDLAVPSVPGLIAVLPVSAPFVTPFKSVPSLSSRPPVPPPKSVLSA